MMASMAVKMNLFVRSDALQSRMNLIQISWKAIFLGLEIPVNESIPMAANALAKQPKIQQGYFPGKPVYWKNKCPKPPKMVEIPKVK
ncbi:hypothetical protein D3C87_309460 [compost metagenome]